MDILLSTVSKATLQQFIKQPGHSLLLLGLPGSGKRYVAEYIAAQLLGLDQSKVRHSAYFKVVEPSSKGLTIDDVRLIKEFMRLKTTGQRDIRRVVVVDQAHLMSIEAQNAFLKQLEEPPADTVIILTATHQTSLLPTILSRTQHIRLQPPTTGELQSYFAGLGFDTKQVNKALQISGGRIGLASDLLNSGTDSPLIKHIDLAKEILTRTTYDRLIFASQLNPKEYDISMLLAALSIIIKAALNQSIKSHQPKSKQLSWHKRAELVESLQESLSHHPQAKLLLTSLCLDL